MQKSDRLESPILLSHPSVFLRAARSMFESTSQITSVAWSIEGNDEGKKERNVSRSSCSRNASIRTTHPIIDINRLEQQAKRVRASKRRGRSLDLQRDINPSTRIKLRPTFLRLGCPGGRRRTIDFCAFESAPIQMWKKYINMEKWFLTISELNQKIFTFILKSQNYQLEKRDDLSVFFPSSIYLRVTHSPVANKKIVAYRARDRFGDEFQ